MKIPARFENTLMIIFLVLAFAGAVCCLAGILTCIQTGFSDWSLGLVSLCAGFVMLLGAGVAGHILLEEF